MYTMHELNIGHSFQCLSEKNVFDTCQEIKTACFSNITMSKLFSKKRGTFQHKHHFILVITKDAPFLHILNNWNSAKSQNF